MICFVVILLTLDWNKHFECPPDLKQLFIIYSVDGLGRYLDRISLTWGLTFKAVYKITTQRNWKETEFGLNPDELQWRVSWQSLSWGAALSKQFQSNAHRI